MAEAVDKRREAETIVPHLRRPRSAVYGGRFMLAYLLLVIVFGGVIALFAFLVSRSSDTERWSAYRPGGQGIGRAQSIANHVAQSYREGRRQLAVVDAQPPVVENVLVDAVAVRRAPTRSVGGGYEAAFPAGNTVMYVFCGYAKGCSLPGQLTLGRQLLLRRQSLELALYTFKYMKDIESVVTLLPPQKGANPAIFLRRGALDAALSKPLLQTLPAAPPYSAESIAEPEASTVAKLTGKRWFESEFQRLSTGRALLVLTKLENG